MLKNAFETTLDKMYNPAELNYVAAANYWNEILTDNEWSLPLDYTEAYYVGVGIDKMMENVGLYLINDSLESNSLTLNDIVLSKAYSTLQYLKNLTATDTNYVSKQINQQVKLGSAQILHNANDFINSKNIVDEMVLNANGIWKEQAEYWQCQWLRESEIKLSENNPDSLMMENWTKCNYGQINSNSNMSIIKYWEDNVIPELKRQNKISKHLYLYPNPASTTITAELETSQKGTAVINIYNIDGKCVKTIINTKLKLGINKISIPISEIIPGTYTISIETRNINWYEKVIIE